MTQVSTYRVPSASRICMLVTGCDSSKGVAVTGLLSACAGCCSVERLNFTCGAGLRNKITNISMTEKIFGYSTICLKSQMSLLDSANVLRVIY